MSTAKTKNPPNGASNGSVDPSTYRTNPEVEAKIDTYIKDNPKHWTYLQGMPRDRLERTVVLNEVRQLDRIQRIRDGLMKEINRNPELKQAYETLLKNVPENMRDLVMTQMASQAKRAIARSQRQAQERP
ncbi:MAG TPA: hypothetical protein VMJ12_14190 [Candidatus Acidoferrales bacterium]|nr:hypothetical protein [Candidatus Acidoferrales bacterium]